MPCAQGVDERGCLTVTCVSNYASPERTSAENKREVSRPWRQPTIISLCIARVFVLRVVQRASKNIRGAPNYHETTNNPISLSIRDWFLFSFFFSFHLFRRISRDKSANSRRETSEFPMNATTTTSYRVCIKNVRKPSFSTSEFRPSWKFDYYLRHQTRRASLLITRGSGQLLA